MIILSIQNGNLIADERLESKDRTTTTLATKELTASDLERSIEYFKKRKGSCISCSSSINWPEDDGGPEYSLLEAFLQKVIHGQ